MYLLVSKSGLSHHIRFVHMIRGGTSPTRRVPPFDKGRVLKKSLMRARYQSTCHLRQPPPSQTDLLFDVQAGHEGCVRCPAWVPATSLSLSQEDYAGCLAGCAPCASSRFTIRLTWTTSPVSRYWTFTRHWPRYRLRRPSWSRTIAANCVRPGDVADARPHSWASWPGPAPRRLRPGHHC